MQDTPTFDELFRAHRDGVYRVAQRLGAPPAAADDLAQETFLVAHQKLDTYEHRGTGMAWLAQIARHLTLRYLRGRQREARRMAAIPIPVHDDATPIDDQLARVRVAASLTECARTLPDKQRQALRLLEVEELSGAEAAEQLGVSVNTVYSRARLAREKLRRLSQVRELAY
jgi:RNA polymerase sigma-70 factor (ECF subfamily)